MGFLRARAQAFLDNQYAESDRLWLDVDSRVQIAIGPYEVKEDSLAGLKAAFEAFVYVSDQKFEFTSNRLRSLLPESQDALESSWANTAELEKNLPIPEELKNQEVLTRQLTGVRPTIHIGELLSESDHEERRLRQVRRHPRPDGREDHEGEADPAAEQRRLLPQHSLQPDLEESRSQVCWQRREQGGDQQSSWQLRRRHRGSQGRCYGGLEHAL